MGFAQILSVLQTAYSPPNRFVYVRCLQFRWNSVRTEQHTEEVTVITVTHFRNRLEILKQKLQRLDEQLKESRGDPDKHQVSP